MEKRSISKKKADALYSLIHEDAMTARVRMATLLERHPDLAKYADNILYFISTDTAQKAIDLFKIKVLK